MKKIIPFLIPLAILLILVIAMTSCQKKENIKIGDTIPKQEWISGTWEQKDIQFAVDIPKDALGVAIPAGSSLIDLAPLLGLGLDPEVGKLVQFTELNTFTFNGDGSYAMANPLGTAPLSFILPDAGTSGQWALTVFGAVVQLTPDGEDPDPHWINDISENTLNISFTLKLAGNEVPMNLILEKQEKEPDLGQQLQWLAGDWVQKDLQFAVTIPKEALGMEIPAGTSLVNMAPLLGLALGMPELGDQIQFTQLNTFSFNSDNTYSFKNPLDKALVSFVLPDAGVSGKWGLLGSGSLVLPLSPDGGKQDPIWVNDLTKDSLSLGIYLDVPNVATIPMNLILEKPSETVDISQKMNWMTGTWTQQDLQFAVDIPKEALGMAIPAGTSLPALIRDPAVAQSLGPATVGGIQAMAYSTYTFEANTTYAFANRVGGAAVVKALFPIAGTSGHWGLVGGQSVVLPLIPDGSGKPDLHWVNRVTEDKMSLRVTLNIGGLPVPMDLLLKK